jgi:hypothetical protein
MPYFYALIYNVEWRNKMEKCSDFSKIAQKFKDGRIICPATLPQDVSKCVNWYDIECKCDKYPQGCRTQMNVYTDAQEAMRDNFWGDAVTGSNCQFVNYPEMKIKEMTIHIKKSN